MTRYSARRDLSFMADFVHLTHRVGLGRKRGRPFQTSSSLRNILLQNPFNFGHGFWMGHQVVTGRNYLLGFGSFQMRAMIFDQSIRAAGSLYRPEMSDDAMEGNFDWQINETVQQGVGCN